MPSPYDNDRWTRHRARTGRRPMVTPPHPADLHPAVGGEVILADCAATRAGHTMALTQWQARPVTWRRTLLRRRIRQVGGR